ncbi:MAG TPA: CHASE3 domain-containing protein [Verrucomicrobiae bacterium]
MDLKRRKTKFASPVTGIVFVATALTVIGTMAVVYWIGRVALESNRRLATQRGIIQLLQSVDSSLKDAESAQRGYLLTAEPVYLAPYDKALRDLTPELAALDAAANQGDLADPEIKQLKRLITDKLQELDRTIKLQRAGDTEGALAVVRSNRGKDLTDAITSNLAGLQAIEVAEFDLANRRADRATRERNAAFFASACLDLVFLAWAYRRISREINWRAVAQEELRKSHGRLEERVSERTAALAAANRDLESSNAQLAAANKELEAFGYSVSHDLRAPLRHVSSYIKLLEKNIGPSLDPVNLRMVRTISEAARRMGSLIDDLLVLSRIGRAALAETNVNLMELAEEARKELASETTGRAINWEIGPLPQVRGDQALLRSAVVNLLSNAIKYTRHRNPAQIELGSRRENGDVVCFVRDNGAGFDMQYADKLFGVFQRLHDPGDFEGTGIGLASVRRIIQRHGGKTWAEGQVDRGAAFYFSLPNERLL